MHMYMFPLEAQPPCLKLKGPSSSQAEAVFRVFVVRCSPFLLEGMMGNDG